jgi:hypothetical protein
MKINEIQAFKKPLTDVLTSKFSPEIRAALEKKGWTYVDHGRFSTVFMNRAGTAILKINKKRDPAYEHFLQIIKTYPSKHFPKISDRIEIGKKYYAYLIERLYPVSNDTSSMIGATSTYLKLDKMKWIPNNYQEEMEEKLRKKDPELYNVLKILVDSAAGFEIDITGTNIMKRKSGTIVIIDPYYRD